MAGGEQAREAAFKRSLAGSRAGVQTALANLKDTFDARITSLGQCYTIAYQKIVTTVT